jgi:hypothetical protein
VATPEAVVNRTAEYVHTVKIVNEWFYYALIAVGIFAVGMLVFRVVELIQRWRWHAAMRGVGSTAKEEN